VLPCGLNGFDNEFRRGVAEGCEDSASVEPADTELAEDVVPVEVARLELAGGGMAAIGGTYRAANTKAAPR